VHSKADIEVIKIYRTPSETEKMINRKLKTTNQYKQLTSNDNVMIMLNVTIITDDTDGDL